MEDIKAQFHNITTELETLLEQYKTAFPRNVGQMVRHNFGKILVFSSLFILIPFVLTLSMSAIIFAFAAFPGVLMFGVLNMHMGNDEVRKEWKRIELGSGIALPLLGDANDAGKLYDKIQEMKSETDKFNLYPDAHNYLEDFDKRFYAAVEDKKKVKSNFWRAIKIGFASIFVICGIFIVRLFYLHETGYDLSYDYSIELHGIDTEGMLDSDAQNPVFVLKGIDSDNQAVFYYYNYTLYATDVQIPSEPADAELYMLTITDKDGAPIARSPRIYFSRQDKTLRSYFQGMRTAFEVVRSVSYIKEHQQDLRYKVEALM